ncbi:MAG: hypothetical protein ABIR26_17130 [Ramlibacter sp.]
MKQRENSFCAAGAALTLLLLCASQGAMAAEFKGAAILDHVCGKVDDANKLSTQEMNDRWKNMPAKDREMMTAMAKELSPTEAQYTADIRSHGLLVVNGPTGKLTVEKKTQDANGSSTQTTTQEFRITGSECLVAR